LVYRFRCVTLFWLPVALLRCRIPALRVFVPAVVAVAGLVRWVPLVRYCCGRLIRSPRGCVLFTCSFVALLVVVVLFGRVAGGLLRFAFCVYTARLISTFTYLFRFLRLIPAYVRLLPGCCLARAVLLLDCALRALVWRSCSGHWVTVALGWFHVHVAFFDGSRSLRSYATFLCAGYVCIVVAVPRLLRVTFRCVLRCSSDGSAVDFTLLRCLCHRLAAFVPSPHRLLYRLLAACRYVLRMLFVVLFVWFGLGSCVVRADVLRCVAACLLFCERRACRPCSALFFVAVAVARSSAAFCRLRSRFGSRCCTLPFFVSLLFVADFVVRSSRLRYVSFSVAAAFLRCFVTAFCVHFRLLPAVPRSFCSLCCCSVLVAFCSLPLFCSLYRLFRVPRWSGSVVACLTWIACRFHVWWVDYRYAVTARCCGTFTCRCVCVAGSLLPRLNCVTAGFTAAVLPFTFCLHSRCLPFSAVAALRWSLDTFYLFVAAVLHALVSVTPLLECFVACIPFALRV